MNIILFLGTLLGLSSVMIAAYIDHTLANYLDQKFLRELLTAVRYHQFYALVICVIGLFLPLQTNQNIRVWLTRAGRIFILGVVLFSFSIYSSVMTGVIGITYLIPIGGILLIIGWACLIRVSFMDVTH